MTAPAAITAQALRLLAAEIQAPDDVPACCLRDAADQLDAQAAEIGRLNKGFHESCIAREDGLRANARHAEHVATLAKERADRAEARVEELEAEVERLRAAMLSALSATRAKVDADCSTELLCAGADEIRLYIKKLWRELAEVQAGADRMKSDAEQAVLEARNREAELAELLRASYSHMCEVEYPQDLGLLNTINASLANIDEVDDAEVADA